MWSAAQNTACRTTAATQKALTLLIPGDATAVNPCGAFIRVWMLHGILGTSLQAEKEPFPVPTPGIKTTNRNLSWTLVKGKTILIRAVQFERVQAIVCHLLTQILPECWGWVSATRIQHLWGGERSGSVFSLIHMYSIILRGRME